MNEPRRHNDIAELAAVTEQNELERLKKENARLSKNEYIINEMFGQELYARRRLGGLLGNMQPARSPFERDYDLQFGYPNVISKEEYARMYYRNPLANRIVNLFPTECWRTVPVIKDDDSPTKSAFQEQAELLFRQFGVWSQLKKIDVLSGIGSYGLLLIGIDDDKPLSEPVDCMVRNTPADHKLIYLRCLPQHQVQITQLEQDVTNPRYGHPVMYQIQTTNQYDPNIDDIKQMKSLNIHWSRVLHVADNREISEIYGVPRLQLVFNLLLDVSKVLGCTGEMFYKGAFPGYAIKASDNQLSNVQINYDDIRKQIELFENNLQRWFGLTNADIVPLSSTFNDPSPLLETYLKYISIGLGCPQRILEGSERGELASSQDAILWNNRLNERRLMYLIPNLIRPFIDRLVRLGVLPTPFDNDYTIEWDSLDSQLPSEKADNVSKQLGLLQTYQDAKLGNFFSPIDFLVWFIPGMTEDGAKELLIRAAKYQAEQATLASIAGTSTDMSI